MFYTKYNQISLRQLMTDHFFIARILEGWRSETLQQKSRTVVRLRCRNGAPPRKWRNLFVNVVEICYPTCKIRHSIIWSLSSPSVMPDLCSRTQPLSLPPNQRPSPFLRRTTQSIAQFDKTLFFNLFLYYICGSSIKQCTTLLSLDWTLISSVHK